MDLTSGSITAKLGVLYGTKLWIDTIWGFVFS